MRVGERSARAPGRVGRRRRGIVREIYVAIVDADEDDPAKSGLLEFATRTIIYIVAPSSVYVRGVQSMPADPQTDCMTRVPWTDFTFHTNISSNSVQSVTYNYIRYAMISSNSYIESDPVSLWWYLRDQATLKCASRSDSVVDLF